MVDKIIRDGSVAVAVSPGYGAGWSTWNNVDPMDSRFNELFLEGRYDDAAALCDELDLGCSNGAFDVVIEWVEQGLQFIITEYDGYEALEYSDCFDWKTT